ncbi:hypothetical protein [Corynebacterium sp. CNJ-954]|uniref:hypothetical protein n=1 Tax=Corynebacterium sp. CNJ-954 TaxID=1904962 RepID=UPI0011153780|nr:hypothetical protein [Corynebacterium sp. CNJ-954]
MATNRRITETALLRTQLALIAIRRRLPESSELRKSLSLEIAQITQARLDMNATPNKISYHFLDYALRRWEGIKENHPRITQEESLTAYLDRQYPAIADRREIDHPNPHLQLFQKTQEIVHCRIRTLNLSIRVTSGPLQLLIIENLRQSRLDQQTIHLMHPAELKSCFDRHQEYQKQWKINGAESLINNACSNKQNNN